MALARGARLARLGLAIGLAGCGESLTCTAELRGVLRVDVVDSVTGAPAAAGATVIVRGTQNDSATAPTSPAPLLTAYTAFEDKLRGGIYSVTVRKSGYHDWTKSNIRLDRDVCHVTTFVALTARLTR